MRAVPFWIVVMLAGCEPADGLVETDAASLQRAPVPLLVAQGIAADAQGILYVEGVPTGADVDFAVSSTGVGAGPCPPAFGGVCFGILGPLTKLGSATAGPQGVAAIEFLVPAAYAGTTVHFQAVVQHGAATQMMNVVTVDVADALPMLPSGDVYVGEPPVGAVEPGADGWLVTTPGLPPDLGWGDLTGDGHGDLLVARSDAGGDGVFVVPGPITSDLDAALAGIELTYTPVNYGEITALDGGLDHDLDGVPDLLVGTGNDSIVYLVHGSAGLVAGDLKTTAAARMITDTFSDPFDGAPEPRLLGDVNGDGSPDLAVGDAEVNGWGAVYLLHGPASGPVDLEVSAAAVVRGSFLASVGTVLEHAGDVTGDGLSDLWIGTPNDVLLFSNPSGELLPTDADADVSVHLGCPSSPTCGDRARIAVGDANGDGTADLAAVSRGTDGVYLFVGPFDQDAATTHAVAHVDLDARFEKVLLADLDGDALAELVVSDQDVTTQHYVFAGPVSGTLTTADAAFHLLEDDPIEGGAVAADVDEDGFGDLLFRGASGAHLVLGGARRAAYGNDIDADGWAVAAGPLSLYGHEREPYGTAPAAVTDCDDANVDVHPMHPELCNAIDDDCDGGVDEGAYGCAEVCDDQTDNDLDGAIDCVDSDCALSCPESVLCGDGVDNDADGLVDCEDVDCTAHVSCAEDCYDLVDNDGDALIDCADDECGYYAASHCRARVVSTGAAGIERAVTKWVTNPCGLTGSATAWTEDITVSSPTGRIEILSSGAVVASCTWSAAEARATNSGRNSGWYGLSSYFAVERDSVTVGPGCSPWAVSQLLPTVVTGAATPWLGSVPPGTTGQLYGSWEGFGAVPWYAGVVGSIDSSGSDWVTSCYYGGSMSYGSDDHWTHRIDSLTGGNAFYPF